MVVGSLAASRLRRFDPELFVAFCTFYLWASSLFSNHLLTPENILVALGVQIGDSRCERVCKESKSQHYC